jgi:protein-S-isoprenylcysteine O-methyltransferase Ste14
VALHRHCPKRLFHVRLFSIRKLSLILRFLFAVPLYLSFFAYMANPNWMAWSSFRLPLWLRWLDSALGLGMLLMLYRVLASLGKNISETVFTKEHHILVTQGRYSWVRHPLYTAAIRAEIWCRISRLQEAHRKTDSAPEAVRIFLR